MGKLFIPVACQLIKGEGMMKIENNHLAAARMVVDSSRRHQWGPILADGSLIKSRNISPQNANQYEKGKWWPYTGETWQTPAWLRTKINITKCVKVVKRYKKHILSPVVGCADIMFSPAHPRVMRWEKHSSISAYPYLVTQAWSWEDSRQTIL